MTQRDFAPKKVFESSLSESLIHAFNLNTTRPDETYRLAIEAVEAAVHAQDISAEAEGYNLLAIAAWSKGELYGARYYAQKSAHLYDSIPGLYIGQARARNTLGVIALETGDFNQAIVTLLEAIPLAELEGSPLGLAYLNGNIAQALMEQDDCIAARSYLDQAYAWQKEAADNWALAVEIASLDGRLCFVSGSFEISLTHYQAAVALCELEIVEPHRFRRGCSPSTE